MAKIEKNVGVNDFFSMFVSKEDVRHMDNFKLSKRNSIVAIFSAFLLFISVSFSIFTYVNSQNNKAELETQVGQLSQEVDRLKILIENELHIQDHRNAETKVKRTN